MDTINDKQVLDNHTKSGRGPRGPFAFFMIFIILAIVDQAAKIIAPHIFRNFQFAFSLPLPVWLMYGLYVAVMGIIVWHVIKHHQYFSFPLSTAWTLILSGAALNIIERIILGYVRDFIYITFYHWTGIYNLADGYILLGIVILLINSKHEIRNSKQYQNSNI